MGFQTVLINVLLMLAYMVCGFLITKCKKAEPDHAKSLSGLLIYVCGPGLVISSFQAVEYSIPLLLKSVVFLLCCIVIQLLFFAILYLFIRKKFQKDDKYRILTAGALFGNCGYFGIPLITALFPDNPMVACYGIMYITAMNLIVFTLGIFLITDDKRFITLKAAFINPTVLSFFFALILYFCRISLPDTVLNSLSLLGKMTAPLCMVILGMRLSSMKLKKIFINRFAYAAAGLRLIAYPLFAYLCVYFLPFFDDAFKTSMFVLSSTPCAAIVLSFAELYGCNRKLSANIVLLTTILSVITIPVLILIFL